MDFEFFYENEANQYQYYVIPKELIINVAFEKLSLSAKFIYALLLDKMSLSIKNNWINKDGKIYVLYQVKTIMKDTGIKSNNSINKYLIELEKFGLIERKRQGFSKANLIYVKNFLKCKKCTSRSAKNAFHEVQYLHTNNTYINNDIKSNRVKDILTPACVRREENPASNSLGVNHDLTNLLIERGYLDIKDGLWQFNDYFDSNISKEYVGRKPSNYRKYIEYFLSNLKRLGDYQITDKFALFKFATEKMVNQFIKTEKTVIDFKNENSKKQIQDTRKKLRMEWLDDVDEFLKKVSIEGD